MDCFYGENGEKTIRDDKRANGLTVMHKNMDMAQCVNIKRNMLCVYSRLYTLIHATTIKE